MSEALHRVGPEVLSEPAEWRLDGYMPTEIDSIVFMLLAHENVHLGQLGCWGRRFGLPSAMAAMPRGPQPRASDLRCGASPTAGM